MNPAAGSTREQNLAIIKVLGNTLDDLEHARIQTANRIDALKREHGASLPHLDEVVVAIETAEHLAELELVRKWRKDPLAKWAKGVVGAGEKSIARLVAEIGDPATRPNPGKLLAYCGLGDPGRKRRKGMTQEEAFALGNPNAKKRCWLIGEALAKRQCPVCKAEGATALEEGRSREWEPSGCICAELGYVYRVVYQRTRVRYSDRVHETACVRCGPAGSPAAGGSPWSAKHQHEAAKRVMVKRFLIDLWAEARHVDHSPR